MHLRISAWMILLSPFGLCDLEDPTPNLDLLEVTVDQTGTGPYFEVREALDLINLIGNEGLSTSNPPDQVVVNVVATNPGGPNPVYESFTVPDYGAILGSLADMDVLIRAAPGTPIGSYARIGQSNPVEDGRMVVIDQSAGLSTNIVTLERLEVFGGDTAFSTSYAQNGAGLVVLDTHCVLDGCRVRDNDAGTGDGGGLYASSGTVLCIEDSEFIDNSAESGGGVGMRDGSLVVDNSLFETNTATGGQAFGGGIYAENPFLTQTSTGEDFFVRVKGSEFTSNFASTNGGGFYGEVSASGPAVQFWIEDSYFFRNGELLSPLSLTGEGGAVMIDRTSPSAVDPLLQLDRSTFEQNQADTGGGAVSTNFATLDIDYCVFKQNQAVIAGGAILIDESRETRMTSSLFEGNEVGLDPFFPGDCNDVFSTGGAVRHEKNFYAQSVENYSKCLFVGNIAGSGGAISTESDAQVAIEYCTFALNRAVRSGFGAALDLNEDASLDYSILWDNDKTALLPCDPQTNPTVNLGTGVSLTARNNTWQDQGGLPCTNCDDQDPIWTTSTSPLIPEQQPNHDYFLAQPDLSPCVDYGPIQSPFVDASTEESLADDIAKVDLGFHYNALEAPDPTSVLRASSNEPISASAGGSFDLELTRQSTAPVIPGATTHHILLGSFAGTAPGFPTNQGDFLPVNWDNVYTPLTALNTAPTFAADTFAIFPAGLQTTLTFNATPGILSGAEGAFIYHAFMLADRWDHDNNPSTPDAWFFYDASNFVRHEVVQ